MRFLTSSPMFACFSEPSWRKGERFTRPAHQGGVRLRSCCRVHPCPREVHRLAGYRRKRLGVPLPQGVSASVKEAARKVVEIGGRDALGTVAKMHFKTAAEVLAGD